MLSAHDSGQRADDADAGWMRRALALARQAAAHGDVPVGAVLVDAAGQLLGEGNNRREVAADPTAHAEMVALRAAARRRGDWRLHDCTLVVTLEPCVMCAGAMVHARIRRLVYGCRDDKAGGVDSLFVIGRDPRLNHRFEVRAGVLAKPCSQLLRDFFSRRR
ncbi:MAG TPA: tRNA adenosine(34) deaminase TadA [Sorangium sp.]|nr:tRNA adenosine(34) deaminase TadA [Sorangium sp.]